MRRLFAILLMLSPCACNGGSINSGYYADGTPIGGSTGSNFPQAAHPAALQVLNPNGSVLTTPSLQVVTFNNDADAAQIEAFASKLATSTYWTEVTTDYGVQALNVATPRRETFTWPASATDGMLLGGQKSDIETYLVAQLDSATAPWGAPNPNTIYLLFMPQGTTVSPDGGQTPSACAANILGWHTALQLPNTGVTVTYAVQPYCGLLTGLTAIDSRTFPASHEIIAAVTNPRLNGYNTLDANHAYWALAGGGEDIGAACVAQQYGSGNLIAKPTDLPFAVQRMWSNAAAKAGHAPCLPKAANEVFFDAVPVVTASVSATLSTNALVPPTNTLGVHIAAGTNAVVPLNLFSDGQTSGNWTVAATEVSTKNLTLTLDKSTGNNGDVLHLTIAVNAGAATTQQELVRISSTLGNITNNEFILVHN